MMTEKIRLLLIKEQCSVVELSKALDTSPQNLYNKLKRDNFCEEDLRRIAQVFSAKLDINFITSKGDRI